MSEQDRPLAEMPDEEYVHHRQVQTHIQDAISEISEGAAGRDRDEIIADLTRALQARGIGPQPQRWLEAVAEEAQQGHTYIEDPKLGQQLLKEQERVAGDERDWDERD
jgi:hypothetical protein